MGPHLAGIEPIKKPKRVPTVPLERDVENAIRKAFKLKHRISLFKTDAGGAGLRFKGGVGDWGTQGTPKGTTGLPAGFPDLVGAIPGTGRLVAIECKRPGGKLTENQKFYLDFFRKLGCVAFWADSVDSALNQFNEQVAA